MSLKNTESKWGGIAKFLHWYVAIFIICNGIYGLWMVELDVVHGRHFHYELHKSIGMTVLALAVLRIGSRIGSITPKDAPMPKWQRTTAKSVEGFLMLLAVLLPLSGWAMSTFLGYPVNFFMQFEIPKPLPANMSVGEFFRIAHRVVFWVVVGFLVMHVGGALFHHFVRRDNTLLAMLPFARLRSTSGSDKD